MSPQYHFRQVLLLDWGAASGDPAIQKAKQLIARSEYAKRRESPTKRLWGSLCGRPWRQRLRRR